jgi:hypothetical protein
MTTYSYANLGPWDLGVIRFKGEGLGNLMFPWARSIAAARKLGLKPIAPTWRQIKLGPILRNEPDKRFYGDLFDCSSGYVTGWKKLRLLATLPRLDEESGVRGLRDTAKGAEGSAIVVFQGWRGYFGDIGSDHQLVHRELIAMTRARHKGGLDFDFERSICAHVRLADFKVGGQQTDVAWFVESVKELRRHLGADTRVHVFSDGSDDELRPLLALSNVRRLTFGSSIADILALSRSRVLLGSRASTFSMWPAYLGRMPVVWPTGGTERMLEAREDVAHVIRAPGQHFTQSFIDTCKSAIAG